ncbi:MAG: SMC-Scp complex subunit ScpB [Candidatus Omnitrophica bacterium]|nr:SMC-Scp complex subunit ScpB [Candidatus Omnitrophota bacterium]
MGKTSAKAKEKEAQLKELRREMEEKLSEQLPQEFQEQHSIKNEKFEEKEIVTREEAKRVVEAILFASSRPMTVAELRKVLKGFSALKVEELISELRSEYERDGRSFRMTEIAGGFEISTEPKYAPWILKLELQKKARQATQSALETLAILAYKQPLTRAEIEDLRGVDVSGVLSTLLERNLIKVVGKKEIPGRPFLYGTTEKFLEHFGLKSLIELPDISEIKSLIEKSVRREDFLFAKDTNIPVTQQEGQVVDSGATQAASPEENQIQENEAKEGS